MFLQIISSICSSSSLDREFWIEHRQEFVYHSCGYLFIIFVDLGVKDAPWISVVKRYFWFLCLRLELPDPLSRSLLGLDTHELEPVPQREFELIPVSFLPGL